MKNRETIKNRTAQHDLVYPMNSHAEFEREDSDEAEDDSDDDLTCFHITRDSITFNQ